MPTQTTSMQPQLALGHARVVAGVKLAWDSGEPRTGTCERAYWDLHGKPYPPPTPVGTADEKNALFSSHLDHGTWHSL